jgi:hypothetical protein
VYKSRFPAIHLQVHYDPDDSSITIKCVRYASHDDRKEDRPIRLPLEIDARDNLYIMDGERALNADELAKKLLGYFA